jgi:hypothetical protein
MKLSLEFVQMIPGLNISLLIINSMVLFIHTGTKKKALLLILRHLTSYILTNDM